MRRLETLVPVRSFHLVTASLTECVVVLPAYQAGGTLPSLLPDLIRLVPAPRILVVNDGSDDTTEAVARTAGVHVVCHERNRGKGAALRTGFSWWLTQPEWNGLLTMDADGQHAPADLVHLVDAWTRSEADIITGRRAIHGSAMPCERRLSNMITSALVSWRTGQRVDDSQCGFRLLTRRVVEEVQISADGFEAETELLIRASARGFRIASAPVQTIYAGERSFMTHWATTKAFVRTLLSEV